MPKGPKIRPIQGRAGHAIASLAKLFAVALRCWALRMDAQEHTICELLGAPRFYPVYPYVADIIVAAIAARGEGRMGEIEALVTAYRLGLFRDAKAHMRRLEKDTQKRLLGMARGIHKALRQEPGGAQPERIPPGIDFDEYIALTVEEVLWRREQRRSRDEPGFSTTPNFRAAPRDIKFYAEAIAAASALGEQWLMIVLNAARIACEVDIAEMYQPGERTRDITVPGPHMMTTTHVIDQMDGIRDEAKQKGLDGDIIKLFKGAPMSMDELRRAVKEAGQASSPNSTL
jgi:hypothetical protein